MPKRQKSVRGLWRGYAKNVFALAEANRRANEHPKQPIELEAARKIRDAGKAKRKARNG